MPVHQLAYYIPPELEQGIISGALKQFGSVVRDNKGHIVKHLKEVNLPQKNSPAALQAIKAHPIIAAGIGAAVVAGGAATVYFVKKKREKEYRANTPECILNFEKSLKQYLKAVRKGNLDEKTIDDLLTSLEAIEASENGEQMSIELSTKDLKSLVNMIYNFIKIKNSQKVF